MNRINPKDETNIELKLRTALERAGYKEGKDFERQFPTRSGKIIDIAFPQYRLAIECDGEYWHNNLKAKRKDRFREIILKRGGWTIMRFAGQKILHTPTQCAEEIKSYLCGVG